MKQIISRALIGFVFVLGIIFILTSKIDAQMAPDIPIDSGGGGSGTTTPSIQVNLTADLDKSIYNQGDQMTVISSTTMTVSGGGGNTNVTVTGSIVDSGNSPTTILYLNTNSGSVLYSSAVFTAPSVAGDYILRVDASTSGFTAKEALTKMATKDIPFTVTNNGATVDVWSIPSSGVKNDSVDVGSKTTINWLASGLGQGASCSSPQNPNVTLIYPSGSFNTGVINSATNYTVTCKDKDGNSTTNTITPATQFVAKQGAEAVSVSPTSNLGNGDQVCQDGGTWCHLPFQTQTDFKNVRQVATIILGSNNTKIETLNGFPHDVISASKDDVSGKVWTVKEDGTYKIDISANGKMTVTINDRGGFIAAVNFYLIINGVKYPISPDSRGDECASTFKYPVQYSITNLKNCDPTIQDQHTSFGQEVPLDFNFTKTVALKAGDTVEIKGLVTGWGFNSSSLRDLWQSISFYLNTNYTNFTITKEAVTTLGAAPANQISGTTIVDVKGASMMVWSQPYVGPTAGIVNGKIKTNEQTEIHWKATGLNSDAYCTSPDYVNQTDHTYSTKEPNTKLSYPRGYFRTEKLPINKEYTVTCEDKVVDLNDAGTGKTTTGGGTTGGSACFIADTLVTLANGTIKNIQDIQIGDVLKGEKANNTVVGFHQPKLGSKLLYSFNGSEYFVTAEHPFKTIDGWKSINPELTLSENIGINVTSLKVGDILITDKGKVILKTIDSKNGEEDTQLYNFILNGDHTYYADGYLVHNKTVGCDTGSCDTSGGVVVPDSGDSGGGTYIAPSFHCGLTTVSGGGGIAGSTDAAIVDAAAGTTSKYSCSF